MSQERTEIEEMGEFGLIDFLTRNNETKRAGTLLSIGDDAAIIDNFDRQTLISSDMLIEGIHFDLAYFPLKHLGFKAVAVNVSDICAMNGEATQITVNIGVSNRFSLEALSELYEGIYAACEAYNVDLIGGDTTATRQGLVISVTAIGEVAPNQYVSRSGAQKGDLVCVSGDLGGAYLGLQLLEREKKVFFESQQAVQPDLGGHAHVVGRFLKPEARIDIIDWLSQQDIMPTSMIDISDGLSSEILHVAKQSQQGCTLFEDKIPFHDETREVAYEFKLDPTMCALNGGEDYELMFTISQADYEKIVLSEQISVVGHITEAEKGCQLISKSGQEHKLVAQGWQAFGQK